MTQCYMVEPDGSGRWRRVDDHSCVREYPHQFEPGAMWYDPDYEERLKETDSNHEYWRQRWGLGPDGHVLCVICPNGRVWNIDGRASNCTMMDDVVHRCWVRHGAPPLITVDKNGVTCQAGAGSIQAGDYHGFLQNGYLT